MIRRILKKKKSQIEIDRNIYIYIYICLYPDDCVTIRQKLQRIVCMTRYSMPFAILQRLRDGVPFQVCRTEGGGKEVRLNFPWEYSELYGCRKVLQREGKRKLYTGRKKSIYIYIYKRVENTVIRGLVCSMSNEEKKGRKEVCSKKKFKKVEKKGFPRPPLSIIMGTHV